MQETYNIYEKYANTHEIFGILNILYNINNRFCNYDILEIILQIFFFIIQYLMALFDDM